MKMPAPKSKEKVPSTASIEVTLPRRQKGEKSLPSTPVPEYFSQASSVYEEPHGQKRQASSSATSASSKKYKLAKELQLKQQLKQGKQVGQVEDMGNTLKEVKEMLVLLTKMVNKLQNVRQDEKALKLAVHNLQSLEGRFEVSLQEQQRLTERIEGALEKFEDMAEGK
jgi:hypothetical protein